MARSGWLPALLSLIEASWVAHAQPLKQLDPVGAATDQQGGFSVLNDAKDVDVFRIRGATYAIVASAGDDGVQLLNVTV